MAEPEAQIPQFPTYVVVAGDPFTLKLRFQDEDRTASDFHADLKVDRKEDSEVLASFQVTKELDGADTVVTLYLPGDTGHGQLDGVTREIGQYPLYDVQQYGPTQTVGWGRLEIEGDITQ